MNQEQRIAAASKFLLQAPPGEINDVLNDVREIVADDSALEKGIQPSLQEYNLSQFITADVPAHDHQTIISDAARVDGEEDRFLDPRSKQTFKFDHLRLESSDPQPYEPDEEAEPFRVALEGAALTYLSNHFHDGVVSVYASPGAPGHFIVQLVANKYNPPNFWSGRWRSEYRVDLQNSSVEGKILVNVHYYEQGNVQLSTTHSVSFPLPPSISQSSAAPSSSKIVAIIEAHESEYQVSINDAYHEMAEKTFKGLRRALPMTRQKMDWDRVMSYKLGADLQASKGAFAGNKE